MPYRIIPGTTLPMGCNKGVRKLTEEQAASGKCNKAWAKVSRTHNGTHRCDLEANHKGRCTCSCGSVLNPGGNQGAAADRIEALEAENASFADVLNEAIARIEQLKTALREIAFDDITGASLQHKEIARAALGGNMTDHVKRLEEQYERMHDALQSIVQWSEAYPIDIFPTPDLKRARELLEAGGITLDSVSAYCMRHVITGVGKIARDALNPGGNNGETKG